MTLRERLQRQYDKNQAAARAEGKKQGLDEGIAKGRAQGIAKGRAEGQRSLLANLLRLKFGPLDEAAEIRLAGATSKELGKWAKRVLTANSLDEIWN